MVTDSLRHRALITAGVKNEKYPRYVYKYRSLKSAFTMDIFTTSQLYFPKPVELNDPFDCQINIDTQNSHLEIAAWIIDSYPSIPFYNLQDEIKKWQSNPILTNKVVNDRISGIINLSGICCFGDKDNDILMWSHYADSHMGIVIKFDLLVDPDFFIVPLPVKYQHNYPLYNYIRDQKNIFDLFQTKSECWNYEGEFRVYKKDFGLYKFNPKAIVEVCFGCNTSRIDIEQFKQLAQNNGFGHIIWKKAEVSKKAYELIMQRC